MIFLQELLCYQSQLLNITLNRRFMPFILCIISLIPCVFGKSVMKAYIYACFILLFGSLGTFICRCIGGISQLCILGFTLSAFVGFMISKLIERFFFYRFCKAYDYILNVLCCCCFPAVIVFLFRRHLFGVLSLCCCIPVFIVCEFYRIKNKRIFYTYKDLVGLPDMEEV